MLAVYLYKCGLSMFVHCGGDWRARAGALSWNLVCQKIAFQNVTFGVEIFFRGHVRQNRNLEHPKSSAFGSCSSAAVCQKLQLSSPSVFELPGEGS